jgi:hypothetical protein
MKPYHLRRKEKAITDTKDLDAILDRQQICTLALSRENEPYLISLDYLYDSSSQTIYFHCAKTGKKMDLWQANPRVYGQVMEDLGYIAGECDHGYRTVHFWGTVAFVTDLDEKTAILKHMIAKFESDTEAMNARFLKPTSLKGVMVGKIAIEGKSGKKSIKS